MGALAFACLGFCYGALGLVLPRGATRLAVIGAWPQGW